VRDSSCARTLAVAAVAAVAADALDGITVAA
jgi:hypothetical protein